MASLTATATKTTPTRYHATLLANAPLALATDAEHDLFLSATIAGQRLPFYLKRPHRRRLEKEPFVEEEKALVLWPRTNREGVLCIGTQLVKWAAVGTLTGEHAFHALGKLTLVDFKDALFHLQIHPNAKSSLSKPFTLPLVASLALLERLPKGGGLEVWGELKPRSGRVVVTKARKVALPVSKEQSLVKADDKSLVKAKPSVKAKDKPLVKARAAR